MANNYERATVQPYIPDRLVTPLEEELLRGFGFGNEPVNGEKTYFFAEDSTCDEFFGYSIDPKLLKDDPSPIAKRLRDYYKKEGIKVDGEAEVQLPSDLMSWPDIFQTILRKPENKGKDAIDEIVVMAGYYCDKLRPGEFGGWVLRVTKNCIQKKGTYIILDEMRKRTLPRRKKRRA